MSKPHLSGCFFVVLSLLCITPALRAESLTLSLKFLGPDGKPIAGADGKVVAVNPRISEIEVK